MDTLSKTYFFHLEIAGKVTSKHCCRLERSCVCTYNQNKYGKIKQILYVNRRFHTKCLSSYLIFRLLSHFICLYPYCRFYSISFKSVLI